MDQYYYISGSTVILSGCSVTVALPTTKAPKSILIKAETGVIYFEVNPTSGSASASSPGYVPQDNADYVPIINNLDTFCVYSTSGCAHLQYFTF